MGVARIHNGAGCWLDVLCRYLVISAAANLVWETLQRPLYTIGQTGAVGEIAYRGHSLHGRRRAHRERRVRGSPASFWHGTLANGALSINRLGAVVIGVGFTASSEWRNTERGSWTYSDLMPIAPVIKTGLSPLAQWIVIPVAAFWWAHRATVRMSSIPPCS